MAWTGGFWQQRFSAVWQHMGACLRPDVISATLAINLLNLALPIVILQLYDSIIPYQAVETLTILMTAMIAVVIMDTALRLCRSLLMNRLGAEFEHNALLKLLSVILRSDFSQFESRRYSDYLEKIKAVEAIRETQFGQNILSLLDLPFIVLFLGMIYFFAGWLVLVPLGLFTAFSLFSLYVSRSLYLVLQDKDAVFEQRHNFLLEILQGMQTLKPLAMEAQLMRRYERLQGRSAETICRLARLNHLVQSSTSTLSQVTMVVFVVAGASAAASGALSVGALAAGSILAGRILQPASRAFNFWMQWQTAKVAEEKIRDLLALPEEISLAQQQSLESVNSITIEDVSFNYDGRAQPIINRASLHIDKNEFVTIVGNNSTGKTTLAKLILGFFSPQEGRILINGKPLRGYSPDSLRKNIAFIPQRGVLFNGSILDNLTAFRSGDVRQQALAYSKSLGVEDIVTRMPDGLATLMDSTLTDNIPEGFRQRIVMIRALLGKPSVIVFDDANTGYDQKNNQNLVSLFKEIKGKCTIIIISNQDDLVALSDRCYRLHHGELTLMHSRLDPVSNEPKSVQKAAGLGSIISGGKFHE